MIWFECKGVRDGKTNRRIQAVDGLVDMWERQHNGEKTLAPQRESTKSSHVRIQAAPRTTRVQ